MRIDFCRQFGAVHVGRVVVQPLDALPQHGQFRSARLIEIVQLLQRAAERGDVLKAGPFILTAFDRQRGTPLTWMVAFTCRLLSTMSCLSFIKVFSSLSIAQPLFPRLLSLNFSIAQFERLLAKHSNVQSSNDLFCWYLESLKEWLIKHADRLYFIIVTSVSTFSIQTATIEKSCRHD